MMRSTINLVIVVSLGLSYVSAAMSAPMIVSRGAGGSEFASMFVHAQLDKILSQAPCESHLIEDLQSHLHLLPQPIFKGETTLGEVVYRFSPDKREVWFNRDRLWQDQGDRVPYDLPSAAGLWLDILAQTEDLDVGSGNRSKDLEIIKQEVGAWLSSGAKSTTILVNENNGALAVAMSHRLYIQSNNERPMDFTYLVNQCGSRALGIVEFSGIRWLKASKRFDGSPQLELELIATVNCTTGVERGRWRVLIPYDEFMERTRLNFAQVRVLREAE